MSTEKRSTDQEILEKELVKELEDLKKEEKRKRKEYAAAKKKALSTLASQRSHIDMLEKQIGELKPLAQSTSHKSRKQMKEEKELMTLLQQKEYYEKEVETKKGLLRQRQVEINIMDAKVSAQLSDYAKKKRAMPRQAPEFVLLDNLSNKKNQMEKRISAVKQENKEIIQNIKHLLLLKKNAKGEEKKLRIKMADLYGKTQKLYSNIFESYEERDAYINKTALLKEKCSRDKKAVKMNKGPLNMLEEKAQKFEEFGQLQRKERSDSRIATTGELIEQGVTGLEPELNRVQDLHAGIVASSGRATPEEMDDTFRLTDDQANSKFSYLEELLEECNKEQRTIDELKEKNRELRMGMSEQEKRMRWEIKEAETTAKKSKSEADAATEKVNQARSELDTLLEKVRSLNLMFDSAYHKKRIAISESPQVQGIEDEKLDDSNALEFIDKMHKKTLECLKLTEYVHVKESVEEEKAQERTGSADHPCKTDDTPKAESESKYNLSSTSDNKDEDKSE